LEDGITKRAISWRGFCDEMDKRCGSNDSWLLLLKQIEEQARSGCYYEALGKIDGHSRDNVYAQIFRTNILGQLVAELQVAFIENATKMLDGSFSSDLIAHVPSAALYKSLKKIEQEYVYPYKATLKLEILGRQIIHDLMDIFWEAVQAAGSDGPEQKGFAMRIWRLLSPSFRLVYVDAVRASNGNAALIHYARLQLVSDYIAGMTDSFACDLHRELYGH
jgi:dGTPase